MLRRDLVLQSLAQARYGDTARLAYAGILVTQAGLDERPDLVHERCHELTTTFDRDTKREHGTTTGVVVCRREVLLNQGAESREDLIGGKVGSETVNDTESRLEERQQRER